MCGTVDPKKQKAIVTVGSLSSQANKEFVFRQLLWDTHAIKHPKCKFLRQARVWIQCWQDQVALSAISANLWKLGCWMGKYDANTVHDRNQQTELGTPDIEFDDARSEHSL
jgi:hypothetical protein